MPLSISTSSLQEKNKLTSSGAFILLLEVVLDETSVYLCNNTENVIWNSIEWLAAPFTLGDITETKESELPTIDLNIVDLERRLTPDLDSYSGGVGVGVWLRIVNTALLSEAALREDYFDITETSINHMNNITFKLGVENLMNYRSPKNRFLKSHCRYKVFKGAQCGYTGLETGCNRTFTRCNELLNTARFGGFPGTGAGGIFK